MCVFHLGISLVLSPLPVRVVSQMGIGCWTPAGPLTHLGVVAILLVLNTDTYGGRGDLVSQLGKFLGYTSAGECELRSMSWKTIVLLCLPAFLILACGSGPTSTLVPTPAATIMATAEPAPTSTPPGSRGAFRDWSNGRSHRGCRVLREPFAPSQAAGCGGDQRRRRYQRPAVEAHCRGLQMRRAGCHYRLQQAD